MRFEYFIIGLFIASMFLIGGTLLINEQINTYGIEMNDSIFVNITKEAESIYDVQNDSKSLLMDNPMSDEDSESGLFAGGYKVMKKTWDYFSIPGRLISAVTKAIGVPTWISNIFMLMMGIAVLFSIVYVVFRFMPRN